MGNPLLAGGRNPRCEDCDSIMQTAVCTFCAGFTTPLQDTEAGAARTEQRTTNH
jgi:hypothetical protein